MAGENLVTVPEFFAGKTIFITGGTGFMGKVLIEKLLRSCPDLALIYVLTRPKKGKTKEERIKQLINDSLFTVLREERPENLQKIVPIDGDVTALGLGLSPENRKLLTDTVNIIYHAAASVRFDDTLKDAILLNTRGTREAARLALDTKNLDVFVHVSTTYCHTDKQVIDEKVYPPLCSWEEAIKVAETVDPHILNVLTAHYISPFPNTYTFSKRLGEDVVNDLCSGKIPTVIIRPSIVINTYKEPVPGWVDNFNGPVGITVAGGKGILRSLYTKPNLIADYIPVDMVIKAIILSTWWTAMKRIEENEILLDVYNGSNNNLNNVTIEQMVLMGGRIMREVPLNDILWYPAFYVTSSYLIHFYKVIFYHLMPALIVDGLLKLFGQKPRLLKIQRKIYIANMALQYFITQDWTFINDKSVKLEQQLLPEDFEAFSYGPKEIDPFEYFKQAAYGSRQYLLNEDISTLPQAIQHSKRMYVLHIFASALWYFLALYLLIYKFELPATITGVLTKIYVYLRDL